MVNKKIWLGIPVLALVFAMNGCPTDDGEGEGTSLGETPTLSGQVYIIEGYPTVTDPSMKFTKYSGTALRVTAEGLDGIEGTITNGKFTLTLKKPGNDELHNLTTDYLANTRIFVDDYYDDLKISPSSGVKVGAVSFRIEDSDDYSYLSKGNRMGATRENLMYMYVDKDVTISGKGKTETYFDAVNEYATKTSNFNLSLKAGWNTLLSKQQNFGEKNGDKYTITFNTSLSVSNPSNLKWVLDGWFFD